MPVMSLVATYFAKRRGFAIGLVTVGNSVGGMIYPTVVRQLLPQVGFGWTVRVLGFINVACLSIVIALSKPRLPPRKSGPLWDPDSFRDVPYILFVLGVCFLMPAIYFVFYYVSTASDLVQLEYIRLTHTQVASFARDELGMPYTQSLNLVIILNGVGLPFRILPGFVCDHYLGPLNMFSLCTFFATVILFCWLGVNSISTYYTFIAFYGIFAAAFQSLFSTAIMSLSHDITKTGTRLGMAMTVIGFSALVGGPLSGAILKAKKSLQELLHSTSFYKIYPGKPVLQKLRRCSRNWSLDPENNQGQRESRRWQDAAGARPGVHATTGAGNGRMRIGPGPGPHRNRNRR
ncbi:uncharacterized protein N0V89_012452 [Didymosphaeria variabile]|uniref:MFS general substrate transporter n=1 Tax=Didymosphaeria variabile TaxID=1932322 RepID=A0A9W8X9A4_9PLEO|nr:uncharacterized protein N0V89_012452 [Didymosphaeria variabile]KAJ4344708.1 hypothetical protein N0V89_012452 [Didymosphaeria variabile]